MKNILLLLAITCICSQSWALTAISTNPVKGGPFCGGTVITVKYKVDAPANSGNVFTAQLSDKKGNFDVPIDIGSVTAKGSGTITATIPLQTTSGSKYKIRVVSSNPVVTGTPCDNDVTINPSPKRFKVNNVTACSAVAKWGPTPTADRYQVSYRIHQKHQKFVNPIDVNDTTYTFTGLVSSTNYDLVVRSVCSNGDVSVWDSVVVRTGTCPTPGNLFVSEIGVTTASLEWPDASCAMDYSFRYRMIGAPNWIYKHPTTSHIDLTGLCAACDYEAYVATRCSLSDSSAYGNQSTWEENYFRLAGNVDGDYLTVYPNPSNGTFTIHFNNVSSNSNVDITVQNIYGQTVYHATQSVVNGLNEKTLSLDHASAGMYFVNVKSGSQEFHSTMVVK